MIFDVVQANELKTIMQDWQKRASSSMDDGYRIALNECIYEVKNLLNQTEERNEREAEEEFKAYFDSLSDEELKHLKEYYDEQEAEANLLLMGEA
jgi:hypothetical protein